MSCYFRPLVEHYLRTATRYPSVNDPVQQQWCNRVHEWLDSLPETDKQLIVDTFGKRGERHVRAHLSNSTHRRLNQLEQDFAIKNNLTGGFCNE